MVLKYPSDSVAHFNAVQVARKSLADYLVVNADLDQIQGSTIFLLNDSLRQVNFFCDSLLTLEEPCNLLKHSWHNVLNTGFITFQVITRFPDSSSYLINALKSKLRPELNNYLYSLDDCAFDKCVESTVAKQSFYFISSDAKRYQLVNNTDTSEAFLCFNGEEVASKLNQVFSRIKGPEYR